MAPKGSYYNFSASCLRYQLPITVILVKIRAVRRQLDGAGGGRMEHRMMRKKLKVKIAGGRGQGPVTEVSVGLSKLDQN